MKADPTDPPFQEPVRAVVKWLIPGRSCIEAASQRPSTLRDVPPEVGAVVVTLNYKLQAMLRTLPTFQEDGDLEAQKADVLPSIDAPLEIRAEAEQGLPTIRNTPRAPSMAKLMELRAQVRPTLMRYSFQR